MPMIVEAIAKKVARKGAKAPGNLLCIFAPLRETSSNIPASRLRVDERPSFLNVKKIQTAAAATPPSAPTIIDNQETCNVNEVVPTAPTHQVRSPCISNAQ